MAELSKINRVIKIIFEKGYYVENEKLYNPYGRELSQRSKDGYRKITIGTKPDRVETGMHKLVAYSKYGDAMFDAQCVRHLDGNGENNHPDNLALGTQQQNMMDRTPADRLAHAKKAAKVTRKLTEEHLTELRNDRNNGWLYKDLCTKYGIAKSTLSSLLNGKTYK
jgi:hypothetical protein